MTRKDAVSADRLSHAQLVQAVVVDSKVVRDLVKDCLAHLLPDLSVVGTHRLNRLLVDRDLVGEREVVILAAGRQRDTVIQPQQRAARCDASRNQVLLGWAALNHDFKVFDFVHECVRKRVHGVRHELLEPRAFHASIIIGLLVSTYLQLSLVGYESTISVMFLFRNRRIHGRVRDLIASGVGVRQQTWTIGEGGADRRSLPQAVLDWVKECMSTMRRPNGVDQVALALACRDDGPEPRCSASLGLLDPQDFYGDRALESINAFLDDVDSLPEQAGGREISGALVCLGDIAFALARDEAA